MSGGEMNGTRLPAAVALAALLTAVALLPGPASGSDAQSAANSTTFRDSTGEDPAGPDITTVTVSNNDAGVVRIQIAMPNRPTLTPDMLMFVEVDSDNNTATGGAPFGIDYVIELDGTRPPSEVNLFRWDGTNFTRRPGDPAATTLIFSYAGGATIEISARELGNTKRFRFAVGAISGIAVNPDTGEFDLANAHADAAPDVTHGLWTYEVKTAPLRLLARTFTATKPRAGRAFTVRLAAARSDTGAVLAGGAVTCSATLAGKRLKARTNRVVKRAAQCVWQIPAGATGQTIRGTVTFVFEGLRVSRSFTAKIL
jgi:hypothetical protein